jgi:hypothetical protein
MPLMNVFEPLFLLLVLVTLVTVAISARAALGGRWDRTGRLLRRLALGAVVYFAVVVLVSLVSARRVYHTGEPQCFDDWCITVSNVTRSAAPDGVVYDVSLTLSNRAKAAPMGEKGTVVYLTDAQGRRFDPQPDPAIVPLETRLAPGTSVIAVRHFAVPADARDVGLVYTHEGGFPISWLILSEGGWFAKPPIVRLD